MFILWALCAILGVSGQNLSFNLIYPKTSDFLQTLGARLLPQVEEEALKNGHFGLVQYTEEEQWLKSFEADLGQPVGVRTNLRRPVFLKDQPQYYTSICPVLELFKQTPIENLKCDQKIMDKISRQKKIRVDHINLASIMTTVKGCLCQKYTVVKGCTHWFFGSKTYHRDVSFNTPVEAECQQQCIADHQSARSGSISSQEPDYSCKWPVYTSRTGTIVKTMVAHATRESITGRLYSGIFEGGSCLPSQCRVAKPNIFVLREEPPRVCSFLTEGDTMSYQDQKGNLTVLESEKTTIQYPVLGGCIINHCRLKILSIPSGQLIQLPATVDFGLPICDVRTHRLPTRAEIPPNVEKTWDQLYDLYDKCLMKRQIIRNALWSKVPLDVSLLREFNHDNGIRNIPQEKKYLVLNSQLLSASCPMTYYTSLTWRNHDLWVVNRGDRVIGCLDARLNIVFQGLCRHYNDTMAFQALGSWKFQKDNESWEAVPMQYNTDNFIKTITGTWFNNELVQDALDRSRNPIIEDPSYETPLVPPGETRSPGIQFKLPNLFSGLFSTFSVIFLIGLAILIFCCCCRVRKVPSAEYIPMR